MQKCKQDLRRVSEYQSSSEFFLRIPPLAVLVHVVVELVPLSHCAADREGKMERQASTAASGAVEYLTSFWLAMAAAIHCVSKKSM